jgi:hypothetical protein
VTRFAVTLPGASPRVRQAAADQLALTHYLRFGQPDRVNAQSFFHVPLADVRRPDPGRDVVEAFIAALPGDGPVQIVTTGLSQEDTYLVSQVLRCAEAAGTGSILSDIRKAWDGRHQVPESDESVQQFLSDCGLVKAETRRKELEKLRKANIAERVKAKRRSQEKLAALVAARAGLVEEEAS